MRFWKRKRKEEKPNMCCVKKDMPCRYPGMTGLTIPCEFCVDRHYEDFKDVIEKMEAEQAREGET